MKAKVKLVSIDDVRLYYDSYVTKAKVSVNDGDAFPVTFTQTFNNDKDKTLHELTVRVENGIDARRLESAAALGVEIDLAALYDHKAVLAILEKQEAERRKEAEKERKETAKREAEQGRVLEDVIVGAFKEIDKDLRVRCPSGTRMILTRASDVYGTEMSYSMWNGRWEVDEREHRWCGNQRYTVGSVTRRKSPANKDFIAAAVRKLDSVIKNKTTADRNTILKGLAERMVEEHKTEFRGWKLDYYGKELTKTTVSKDKKESKTITLVLGLVMEPVRKVVVKSKTISTQRIDIDGSVIDEVKALN